MAEIIGHLVAVQPGMWIAPLFIKELEIFKDKMLKLNKWRYETMITLPSYIIKELDWWKCNVEKFPSPVTREKPCITVKTDASKKGWGGGAGWPNHRWYVVGCRS